MSSRKTSRTQRWLSVIIPSAALVAGVLLLARQAVSSSAAPTTPLPNGTARVAYEVPGNKTETSAGQSLVVRMNNWQATSITGGCHKVN